jgi:hypothetical protein
LIEGKHEWIHALCQDILLLTVHLLSKTTLISKIGFSAGNDKIPQALMALLRRYISNTGVQVFRIVPRKIAIKVLSRLFTIQKAAGVFWSPFNGTEW